MIENPTVLIAFPDFTGKDLGKFYLWDGQSLSKVSSIKISKYQDYLIAWEFEPIAASLMSSNKQIPSKVLELEELMVSASQNPHVKEIREAFSIRRVLERFGCGPQAIDSFRKLNCGSKAFPQEVLEELGEAVLRAYRVLERALKIRGEYRRFIELEVPVSHVLRSNILRGVRFDRDKIASYREDVEHDYFMALKNFSSKHNMPLRTPTDAELQKVFESNGFDFDNVSIEYILEFAAKELDFGADAKKLRRLHTTMSALESISHRKNTTFPTVVVQGTRTSRITLRNPFLQNLSKNYRDIFLPSEKKILSYVDYDQFEVGIMAALSGDPQLLKLYNAADFYAKLADDLFSSNTPENRKNAKILFLSYAYGMRRQNLRTAAQSRGATSENAKSAFEQFKVFEKWKKGVEQEIQKNRKIGTALGNFYHIGRNGNPTAKQKRSAVSQVVQGTGSLIFKKALINLNNLGDLRLLIPLHDAVLVEHKSSKDVKLVVDTMERAMTEQLDGIVEGKASVSEFR